LRIARTVARAVAELLLFCFCLLALFVFGIFVTFEANRVIYGAHEFEGNAGAGFAVLLEGICAGLVLAMVGLPFVVHRISCVPWLQRTRAILDSDPSGDLDSCDLH